jgi:hypothetical protein
MAGKRIGARDICEDNNTPPPSTASIVDALFSAVVTNGLAASMR